MTNPLSANETLEREFLLVRAKLLEIAAAFDRIERGKGSVETDPRLKQIAAALEIIAQPIGEQDGNAAERASAIQLIFSLPYNKAWRETFQILSTK